MKKFILTILMCIASTNNVNAQNYKQTINWLKENVELIDHVNCPSNQLHGNEFKISKKSITIFDEYQTCEINIENITNIKFQENTIYIISNKEHKPIVMQLKLHDQFNLNQYSKKLISYE